MCKKNGHKSMRIEVKGTSENGGEVTVTRGEVESTEEQLKLSYNLAIVHSIFLLWQNNAKSISINPMIEDGVGFLLSAEMLFTHPQQAIPPSCD